MDFAHFGLRARPFRSMPDVDAYYPATTHEIALADLRRALADGESLMLLQGDPGTGKTLLAHLLMQSVPEGSRTVFLTHGSFRRRADLLRAILYDLGLPYQEMTEQELRLAVTESCLEHFREYGHTVIVADEAHLLPPTLLDELRLLSDLAGKEGGAVQVVLIGLPSIAETIAKTRLAALRQRLAVTCRLGPLGTEESADYLLHQIRWAGGRPEKLFGEDVLDIISHASRGIPRLLNQAASSAMSLAEQAGATMVDAEAAVEAVSRLGLDEGAEQIQPLIESPPAVTDVEPVTLPMPPVQPAPVQPIRCGDGPPMYIYGDANAVRRAG
jgi:type II secretory pathway predicted ATPase ExeA